MTLYNVYVELAEPVEGWQVGIVKTGLEKPAAVKQAVELLDEGYIGVVISEVRE